MWWKDILDELNNRIFGRYNRKGLVDHVSSVKDAIIEKNYQLVAYYFKELFGKDGRGGKCWEIEKLFENVSKHEEIIKIQWEFKDIKFELKKLFDSNMSHFEKYL